MNTIQEPPKKANSTKSPFLNEDSHTEKEAPKRAPSDTTPKEVAPSQEQSSFERLADKQSRGTNKAMKSSPSSKPSKLRTFLKWSFRIVGVLCLIGVVSVIGVFAYFAKDLPEPGKVNDRFLAESTKIYDRSGNHLLYEVHGEEKRTVVPYNEIPEVVRAATITLEDRDFYSHHGIKFTSIARAVLADVFHRGAKQGGSTITQQFVKNSLLSSEKTLTRKVKEVILSLEIETKFSKDEILAMYLNEIPYGSNAYGIEAAAQTFFGKHARELTLDESALLASLPNAPTYYSPYGSHLEALKIRQEYALQNMANSGYITQEQADEAKATDVFAKLAQQSETIDAPHFVMYVKEYIEAKYGDQAVEQGGLRVYTTLDWDLQKTAEQIVAEGAEKNLKHQANNAALASIDPKTGQILVMVGSKNYFAKSAPEGCVSGKDCSFEPNVNVTIRDRQPGSSFKPYVYLAAFIKGYLPETILYDAPTNFSTTDGKEYIPNNYNGKFNGPISLARALGGSLNIPAVKTLYLVGVKDTIALAKSLGITSLNQPDRYGLSLVLGGGEVKLLDHVNAYATLAQGGVKRDKTAILRIEDAQGNILEEYVQTPGERVIEEKYVAMLDSVLSNNENRAWIFGEHNPFRSDNRPMAAKTGTTNGFRDAWAVGYTPSIATGVWVGNNDNRSMDEGADGSVVAAPIWRAFMDRALVNSAVEKFPEYKSEDYIGEGEDKTDKVMINGKLDQAEDIKVCEIPGEKDKYCIANKYCPDKEVDKKSFISGHDILHYVKIKDPRGDIPDKSDRDPQYKAWEKGVEKWYDDKDHIPKHTALGDIPKDECKESDFAKYKPSIALSVPSDTNSKSITLSAKANAPYGVKEITFSIDGEQIASKDGVSPSISYDIPENKNNSSFAVEVKITDNNGNVAKDAKTVSVSYIVTP